MPCDILVARNEMLTLLKTAWDLQASAIVNAIPSYTPEILYQGKTKTSPPPTEKFYARLQFKPQKRYQCTLQGNVDGLGKRRYNNTGYLQLHIFNPLSDSQNESKGLSLGVVARDAFSGKTTPSGICFYNPVVVDFPPTEKYNVKVFFVDYEYHEIN